MLARLGSVVALAAAASAVTAQGATANAGVPRAAGSAVQPSSVSGAYLFLDQMMDQYARGSTLRLVQSFSGGVLGKRHFTASITYDDALVIDAYLTEGTAEGLSRAETIGDALLYVQANDPAHDGRVRAAYAPTPLLSPSDVEPTEPESDVGNMAWVGQALVHLYEASGEQQYLAGAQAIGEWVQTNCYDTRGAGGYTGGLSARGKRIEWKSTEHNIDLYSLFTLLARATGAAVWSTRAAWAQKFVEAMWEPREERFYIGTTEDGITLEDSVQPEDVNSWSYLALENPAYAGSVSWDETHLAVTKRGFAGVSFCAGARKGVWFEGTAHLADALELRGEAGDAAQAQTYMSDIELAQTHGLNNDGLGIIASSTKKLSDCEGEFYFASLHTGATAWYLLAAARVDPFLAIGS